MKAACVQMNILYGDPEQNFARAEQYIIEAAEAKADMIILPEMWNTGYALDSLETLADRDGTQTTEMLSRLAKKYRINIIGGSTAVKRDGKFYNTMYVADRSGTITAQYDKAHLFQLMDEHLYINPGQTGNIFSLDGIICGGIICYDLRFPEWVRTHVLNGAKILFIPAQWPANRVDHWQILLQARAIENQCFIVAVNRTGSDRNNRFNGHSMVIAPWGEKLLCGESKEGIFYADLDLEEVDKVRSTIPIFQDRRTDLY
ncbi:carbon-nitrogen family hydrolase [Bacillus benzoevorans]|uniref:Putative amidohydrolase n=1 Tax=Bacillus benzoevorans TaxID=1456 RepID=A0A7X0HTW8_9BACI|nr:carbon-nitrogen family hydrolase [Bacillus benzoevorans]MBB6445491.1 putative amidohydrolase [Bacillus benzoevorans]